MALGCGHPALCAFLGTLLVRPRGLAQTQQIPENWIISENPKGGQCDLFQAPTPPLRQQSSFDPCGGGVGGVWQAKQTRSSSVKKLTQGLAAWSSPPPPTLPSPAPWPLRTTCKFSLQAAIPRAQPQSLGPAMLVPLQDQASPSPSDTALAHCPEQRSVFRKGPRLVPPVLVPLPSTSFWEDRVMGWESRWSWVYFSGPVSDTPIQPLSLFLQ